jgi:hypothetical protein
MELPSHNAPPLLEALADLHALVLGNPYQPLHQIAEGVVMHWLRVVEDRDTVQPRFSPESMQRSAFHHGFEGDPGRQLERSAATHGIGEFDPLFRERLDAVAARLRAYFGRKGYRSSAEQCDRVMLELERLSRFLSAWMARVEWDGFVPVLHPARTVRRSEDEEFPDFQRPDDPPARVRWRHLLWEPYLNEAIVAWEENALQPYDAALEKLLALAEMNEQACPPYFMRPGFPLRPRGRRRTKVAVFSPTLRPLRTKSVFNVRFNQLVRKAQELAGARLLLHEELVEDVRFLIGMIRENVYQIANEPGFLTVARPGVPIIRGRPSTHPFLLDTAEFFKKAILFDNGTYTIDGGGIDTMFLQVRQLERYFRFQGGPAARRALATIEACTIGWEENRWKGFTRGLVQIAERLREWPPSP